MEFGKVSRILSHKLNETVVMYESLVKVGCVYKFYHTKDNEYRCCRCKELGRYRAIRIINDTIVDRKNPEHDHHPDCEPLPKSSVLAHDIDRNMRNDVQKKGKRPRDAYNEMLGTVAKRFKTSAEQVSTFNKRHYVTILHKRQTLPRASGTPPSPSSPQS